MTLIMEAPYELAFFSPVEWVKRGLPPFVAHNLTKGLSLCQVNGTRRVFTPKQKYRM